MKTAPIITHKGISVYRTTHSRHKDVLTRFCFSTRNGQTDVGASVFDIRDIPGYSGPSGCFPLCYQMPKREVAPFDEAAFLRQAIDSGHLKRGGVIA
jgi:hypothetical protein